jgi:ferritin
VEERRMLSAKMTKALNDQLNFEYFSAYLYLQMSAHFEAKGLKGCANWMRIQYQEELSHVDRFFDFILERGSKVTLAQIAKPKNAWKTNLSVFKEALVHEQKVTGRIGKLVNMARAEKDHATENFLQWFVAEQVEEEASVGEIVDQISLAGEKGGGMYMVDKELGGRVFTPPAAAE